GNLVCQRNSRMPVSLENHRSFGGCGAGVVLGSRWSRVLLHCVERELCRLFFALLWSAHHPGFPHIGVMYCLRAPRIEACVVAPKRGCRIQLWLRYRRRPLCAALKRAAEEGPAPANRSPSGRTCSS